MTTGYVRVEYLTGVKPDREAFKHLVLDDEVKHTVRTLIGKFASDGGTLSPWPRDLIKNKGEGRIFLLHGSPGVGRFFACIDSSVFWNCCSPLTKTGWKNRHV